MELRIPLEKLCYILIKARAFDAKVPVVDSESGSNAGDDGETDVLEDRMSDGTEEELTSFIDDLNEDEAVDLVALTWVGRGTYGPEDWEEARDLAAHEGRGHSTSAYLLGIPLLASYIEAGLDAFDLSCTGATSEVWPRAER